MRVEAVVVTARYFRYRKHFDEADKDKDGFLNLQVAACFGVHAVPSRSPTADRSFNL